MRLTNDEKMMILLYSPGTRTGLLKELAKIKAMFEPDEAEKIDLADSVLQKVRGMSDAEFEALDLLP